MSVLEILILAVGLSMDAFAVSICKGLAVKDISFKKAAIVGLWFGGFQALMPMIGYFLGSRFSNAIQSVDHWVAFILLSLIGANMIREALSRDEDAGRGSMSTCIISMTGAKVGSVFGTKYKSKAELTGGVMLILLGLKILLEHTGILADLMA